MTADFETSSGGGGADIRTFLIADVRGYTQFSHEHGDEAASELAGRFADLVRAAVPEFAGELLELRGDEALCVFSSARQALRASVALQRRLRASSASLPAFPLGVGIGLDAGEAVPTQGGFRGGALNLAARLSGIAKGGEILASDGVVHLARRVDGLSFHRARPARVKGLAEPVRYFEIIPDDPLPPPSQQVAGPRHLRGAHVWRWIALAVASLVALVVAVVWVGAGGGSTHDSTAIIPIHADSLVVLDARSGHVVRDIRLAGSPGELTAGAGAVWVGSDADQTVSRVNPKTYHADPPLGIGVDPAQMTVAFGSVWAYDASADRLARIDPSGRTRPASVTPVPCAQQALQNCGVGGLTADPTGLWVGQCCISSHSASVLGSAWHLDRRTLKARLVRHVPSDRLAYGDSQLWAYGANGFFAAWVSLLTHKVTPYAIPNANASTNAPGLTVADGSAWIVSPQGTLFGYTQTGLQHSVSIPAAGYEIAAAPDSLWVIGSDGTVTEFNSSTLAKQLTLHLHHAATGITYFQGRVWIAVSQPA